MADLHHDDPDMSIHQWVTILQDEELTTPEILMVLKYIHESGDERRPTSSPIGS